MERCSHQGEGLPPQGQLEGPILTPASGGSAGLLTPESSPVQLAPRVGRDCMCVIFKSLPKVAVICHSIHRKLIYFLHPWSSSNGFKAPSPPLSLICGNFRRVVPAFGSHCSFQLLVNRPVLHTLLCFIKIVYISFSPKTM